MPLKECENEGKSGWKWGDQGKCYTGKEGKKQAIRQGIVIEGPKNFKKMIKNDAEIQSVMGEDLMLGIELNLLPD